MGPRPPREPVEGICRGSQHHGGVNSGPAPQPETSLTQRVLGTGMGDTFPNQPKDSEDRNPTFYHIGTLDPLGEA